MEITIGLSLIHAILENLKARNGVGAIRTALAHLPALRALLHEALGEVVVEVPPVEPASKLAPWRVENNQVLLDGRLWKGLGVNLRELAFYGLGIDPIRWATDQHFFQQLDGVKNRKAKVIRIYCAHKNLTAEQCIPRVKRVLDEAQKRGLYVILCLTDGATSDFFVGDTAQNKQTRYTWEWINGGYKNAYWSFVDKVTKALGDHPAIWAWEPINELTIPSWGSPNPITAQSEAVLDFFRQVTNLIRANSPTKIISDGNISSWENFVLDAYTNGQYAAKKAQLPNLDIVSFHSYAVTPDLLGAAGQHIRDEISLIKSKNVRKVGFILGETAARWDNSLVETSAEPVQRLVDEFFRMGGSLAILWGWSEPHGVDIGVHGAGYWNGSTPPHSTRWHNITGWLSAVATELERAFGA